MSSASTAAELMAKLGEAETYIAELERALHRATGVPVPSRPARHKYEAALPLEIGESDGLLAFLNSLSHLSFVLDMEGNILQINDAVTARLGFTTEELIGQSILMVHPPERRAEAARIVQAILADEATQCVAPLLTKDGRRLPVETHIVKGLWRGRSVIFGVTKDLSEMAAAEERFRAVFHDSPAPMAISDVQTGAYIEVNAAFLHMSGYARDEVVGKTALALSIFLDSAQRDILLARMKVQGRLDGENLFVQTKAGEVRHGIFSANYIEIAGHICLLTVMNDVTVRQQAEDELRRNRERYRALVDALDVALCRWRPDTTLTFTNEKYRVIFGIHGDAIGQKWLQFVPDVTRAATTEFYRQLAAAPETVSYEHPVTVDEGQVRYYHWIDTPIFDAQGKLVEFQSVGLDITDRKEAEDTLREKQAVLQEAQTAARLQSWYADFQTGLVTISPGYEAMSGWSAGIHPRG